MAPAAVHLVCGDAVYDEYRTDDMQYVMRLHIKRVFFDEETLPKLEFVEFFRKTMLAEAISAERIRCVCVCARRALTAMLAAPLTRAQHQGSAHANTKK